MHTVTGLMLALAASILLFTPTKVDAKIYKCVGGDGAISYSQKPCTTTEKTSKIMEGTSARERFDCRVARAFSMHVAKEMNAGLSADDLFSQYGGADTISPTTMSVINYVFSHKSNEDTSVHRIAALSGARCDTGSYSREIDCEHFPLSFIKDNGGCSVVKGESSSVNASRDNQQESGAHRTYAVSKFSSDDDEEDDVAPSQYTSSNATALELKNYNVSGADPGEKQNECRVAIRDKISELQDRMRARLSMEEHDRLSEERKSLRDAYEDC